ncbi:ABC-three component system middle component 1 [Photobacterium carnosum]|uniref:Uncharacterized protein n=1 Tax=Photobacterium carnosum TaxID=2023717 RepID=A0A2N4UQS1_9GAMM|nr:ABC-three component system middle component 1 [Photobacterium carnosum]PLC57362.1 hypothetical protein CIK00_13810 [Photobacterium carnosum]
MDKGFLLNISEIFSIEAEFNNVVSWLHVCQVSSDEESKLSCISIQLNSEEYLWSNWEALTNEVAINYISTLKSTFSKWNCYIIFACTFNISKELKYKIENNKFAARKIIIEVNDYISEPEIRNIINNRILAFNINLSDSSAFKVIEQPLSKTSDILIEMKLPLDKKDESINKRQAWIAKEIDRIKTNEN